ncbi:MAG TPA: WbuC family cupin fold metalloprotein [Bacteroidales bacterium]
MQKINSQLLNSTLEKASSSPRLRMNYNFHPTLDAIYQRMLNCLMPGTYCRPHRHSNPSKNESFIILKGRVLVLEFDNEGEISDFFILNAKEGNYGVDFLPNTWHTIIALEPSVVFEAKDDPYSPLNDKDFAPWAPKEGSEDCQRYNRSILEKLGINYG